jgi:hypothetical protein
MQNWNIFFLIQNYQRTYKFLAQVNIYLLPKMRTACASSFAHAKLEYFFLNSELPTHVQVLFYKT